MALVAYDNSDSSEFEEDEESTITQIETESKIVEEAVIERPEQVKSIFNHLPQPSAAKKDVLEEDDEFLHKKERPIDVKPKSRITIPSLKDFQDVEHTVPIAKTKTSNGKKSGLLSILPEPKNAVRSTTKSLIPNIISQKPQTTTVKKKDLITYQTKIAKVVTKSSLVTEYSDESDNDEVQNDFFSINKQVELPEDLPLEEEELKPAIVTKQEPRSLESYFKKDVDTAHAVQSDYLEPSNSSDYYSLNVEEQTDNGVNENSNVLDDEAILKLCGTRGKRKREEIQIVDVKQDEVLGEAREWLLKGLMDDTTKRQSASKKHGNEPTSQQRRKHQITYLAHQAKANEADLQNQWANNRMTRRQTQSKYGF